MWPFVQRRTLDELFESIAWHAKPERIVAKLRVEEIAADDVNAPE